MDGSQFNAIVVLLSGGISFLGAYTAICACEQLRGVHLRNSTSSKNRLSFSQEFPWLLTIGIALGGIGIWSMHFIGMAAMTLNGDHHEEIAVKFHIGISIMSMIAAVIFISIGISIASRDRVFAKSRAEILELFILDFNKMTLQEIRNISQKKLLFMICTKELHYLLLGGFLSGTGICIMHYIGMVAMIFPGHIQWNVGVVAASVIYAILASSIAFWILFRLLSIYPTSEWLRIASSSVMMIAVCGMHYGGMMAATYVPGSSSTDLHWNSQSIRSSDILLPVLFVAIVILWISNMFIAGDLRWKINRYRHYLAKNTLDKEKFLSTLADVEFQGYLSNGRSTRSLRASFGLLGSKFNRPSFVSNSVAPSQNSAISRVSSVAGSDEEVEILFPLYSVPYTFCFGFLWVLYSLPFAYSTIPHFSPVR